MAHSDSPPSLRPAAFSGGGNMARSLIGGLIARANTASIRVAEPVAELRNALQPRQSAMPPNAAYSCPPPTLEQDIAMTRFQSYRCVLTIALAVLLAACGGTSTPAPSSDPSAQGDAIARVGNISVRASPIHTSMLDPAVAQQYGIVRDDNTILLLVAVRQGPETDETSLPAQITASVTDLRGHKRGIAMREVRIGDPASNTGQVLIDYVGTVETALPETLRFDVKAVREGKAITTIQFNREFYPQ